MYVGGMNNGSNVNGALYMFLSFVFCGEFCKNKSEIIT